MWIKSGRFYFNTDNITFIQVTMNDSGEAPKSLHLHFVNERDNFTLHNDEAVVLLERLMAIRDDLPIDRMPGEQRLALVQE